MSHTVPDNHVKLVLLILDTQNHGHGLANLDNATHFTGPRTFSRLDLHPALEIVAQEIGGDSVEHVDLEGPERNRLLVVVVPGATEFSGLVPHLLNKGIILKITKF